jgi:hypothetical protein
LETKEASDTSNFNNGFPLEQADGTLLGLTDAQGDFRYSIIAQSLR